jgi:TrmH family RNA methyltransferase
MIGPSPERISARGNAFLKDLRRLSQNNTAYREQGRFWAEGEHLVLAALARGVRPEIGVFSESFWPLAPVKQSHAAIKNIVISDSLFAAISGLESPAGLGFVFQLPPSPALLPNVASVILDRVQDAGNVGSILRSASAFGFKQVIALKGSAALWSPKVFRAGMGAHWDLQMIEGASLPELGQLMLPILVTSSHRGNYLHQMLRNRELPMPCVWALGNEGQGVSAALEALATTWVRIAQPGGEESLNVAVAAAICLHAGACSGLS